MAEYAYRMTSYRVSSGEDEWGHSNGPGRVGMYIHKYEVIKHTLKGFWIQVPFDGKRFVLKDARKRYACLTEEEAAQSFIARKQRYISILSGHMADAKRAIELAERVLAKIKPNEELINAQ